MATVRSGVRRGTLFRSSLPSSSTGVQLLQPPPFGLQPVYQTHLRLIGQLPFGTAYICQRLAYVPFLDWADLQLGVSAGHRLADADGLA
jgi:hypothetical protein